MDTFITKLVTFTEDFLTKRARKKFIVREKQKLKHPVLDWLDAFVWAVVVILILNQFLFQAYEIPSGSMNDTLLEHDRLLVNKLVYGPEVLPGWANLPSPIKAQRGDIIIFESPDYIKNESKGPLFDLAQRIIYMATLSLVDIDRRSNGEAKAHFLVKRAAAVGGDWVRFRAGELEYRPLGEQTFYQEPFFKKASNLDYVTKRMAPAAAYPNLPAVAQKYWFDKLSIPLSAQDQAAVDAFGQTAGHEYIDRTPTLDLQYEMYKVAYTLLPQQPAHEAVRTYLTGIFVPYNSVLPLGDNRDNSHDGRFFGPITQDALLGQAAFRYWPLNRFGGVH